MTGTGGTHIATTPSVDIYRQNPREALPGNAELVALAKQTARNKLPDEAITDLPNFVAHVLTYGAART